MCTVIFLGGCQVKPIDINFNDLHRPDKPNYYLACPKDECNIQPDIFISCYSKNVESLKQSVLDYIKQQPRYTLLSDSGDQLQYVQRSFVFRFPDYITFHFYDCMNNESSLSILSFSKYGYSDFGVNKNRVEGIIHYLNDKK
jgi:uncharacterized protein (DUF1499 family)